jgi:preprotein translocase subunit SecG
MWVYYVLIVFYLLVCLLLLLVVLLQQGKGGDMASAFGGGGSSQTAFGARTGATVLTRATTILGALFMLGAIILGIYGQRGPGSVLSGVKAAPVQPVSTSIVDPPKPTAPQSNPQPPNPQK